MSNNTADRSIVLALCACVFVLSLTAPGLGAVDAKSKKPLPDLTITRLTAVKKTVNGKPRLIVTYTVKNIGTAPAPASVTKLSVQQLGLTAEQACTPLQPNAEYSTHWVCPVGKAGKYLVKAGANYRNSFPETNQMNNGNSISFGFSHSL